MIAPYKPIYFQPWELVDPQTYSERGADRCMSLVHDGMLRAMDFMREKRGRPVTVNNWHRLVAKKDENGAPLLTAEEIKRFLDPEFRTHNGVFIFRCVRMPWCTEGVKGSQHHIQPDGKNNACDSEESGHAAAADVKESQDWLQAHVDAPELAWVMRSERRAGWLHLDGLAGRGPRIHFFNP